MGLFDFLTKSKWQYVQQGNFNIPVWSTQKDKQFVTEAYNRIVWVYACIGAISNATSSVPWLLYRKGRGGKLIEIEEHPILTILNKQANPYMSSKDFLDYWVTYLAIEGKFYGEYINPNMPTAIFPLYPHNMSPIPHKTEFISGFEYRVGDAIRFNANEILWSKFNDPLDIYQGLSPIRSLSRTIDTENEAVDWNKSTLQNAGVPAGVFQVTNPSPELSAKLQEEWAKRYAGGSNSRKPLILNSDKASYLPLGLSPIDMDFLNQRKVNRIEICSAFGVPSQIVGDPEGQTYSNYGEAQKAFWENTVISKYLEHIKDKLTQDLLPRYADNLELRYDLSGIGALKESQDLKAKRVMELFKSNIITRNEVRYELDYEEIDTEQIFYQDTLIPNSVSSTPIEPNVQQIPEQQVPEDNMPEDNVPEDVMPEEEEIVFIQISNKKAKETNFPKAGEDKEISLRNSNYPLFPIAYAEKIKNEYPKIWAEGGNIQGNDTYRVLKSILDNDKTSNELTENDKQIIKMREAWSARHFKDYRLAGIIAQVKWLMIGSRGIDHMKNVIQEAIDKEENKKYLNLNLNEQKLFYKKIERKREPYYNKIEKEIKNRFDEELKKIIKNIKKSSVDDIYQNVDNALNDDLPQWRNLLSSIYISVMDDFGTSTFNELKNIKSAEKFNVYDDSIMNFIKNSVAEDLIDIDKTTRNKIKNVISDSLSEGKGIPDISLAITNLYNENFKNSRATMIARTETISASNSGSLEGAKYTELPLLKKWIPTFDDSTRDTHLNMSGKPAIGLNELFDVGDSQGSFAGDPKLSARERINCRCTIAYERKKGIIEPEVLKIDEKQNLINSIINNHDVPFKTLKNSEDLKIELQNILNNLEDDDVFVYEKLSKNFINNNYNNGLMDRNFYSHLTRKISMNINHNNFERITKNNRIGAFNMKFHEEFHQLDDLFLSSELSNV